MMAAGLSTTHPFESGGYDSSDGNTYRRRPRNPSSEDGQRPPTLTEIRPNRKARRAAKVIQSKRR